MTRTTDVRPSRIVRKVGLTSMYKVYYEKHNVIGNVIVDSMEQLKDYGIKSCNIIGVITNIILKNGKTTIAIMD